MDWWIRPEVIRFSSPIIKPHLYRAYDIVFNRYVVWTAFRGLLQRASSLSVSRYYTCLRVICASSERERSFLASCSVHFCPFRSPGVVLDWRWDWPPILCLKCVAFKYQTFCLLLGIGYIRLGHTDLDEMMTELCLHDPLYWHLQIPHSIPRLISLLLLRGSFLTHPFFSPFFQPFILLSAGLTLSLCWRFLLFRLTYLFIELTLTSEVCYQRMSRVLSARAKTATTSTHFILTVLITVSVSSLRSSCHNSWLLFIIFIILYYFLFLSGR